MSSLQGSANGVFLWLEEKSSLFLVTAQSNFLPFWHLEEVDVYPSSLTHTHAHLVAEIILLVAALPTQNSLNQHCMQTSIIRFADYALQIDGMEDNAAFNCAKKGPVVASCIIFRASYAYHRGIKFARSYRDSKGRCIELHFIFE